MTSQTVRSLLSWFLLFLVIAGLFMLAVLAPAQQISSTPTPTLHRHEPSELSPLSCRDNVAHQRRLLILAAPLQTTRYGTREILKTAHMLDSLATIDHVCARKNELANLNIMGAVAESQIAIDKLSKMEASQLLDYTPTQPRRMASH